MNKKALIIAASVLATPASAQTSGAPDSIKTSAIIASCDANKNLSPERVSDCLKQAVDIVAGGFAHCVQDPDKALLIMSDDLGNKCLAPFVPLALSNNDIFTVWSVVKRASQQAGAQVAAAKKLASLEEIVSGKLQVSTQFLIRQAGNDEKARISAELAKLAGETVKTVAEAPKPPAEKPKTVANTQPAKIAQQPAPASAEPTEYLGAMVLTDEFEPKPSKAATFVPPINVSVHLTPPAPLTVPQITGSITPPTYVAGAAMMPRVLMQPSSIIKSLPIPAQPEEIPLPLPRPHIPGETSQARPAATQNVTQTAAADDPDIRIIREIPFIPPPLPQSRPYGPARINLTPPGTVFPPLPRARPKPHAARVAPANANRPLALTPQATTPVRIMPAANTNTAAAAPAKPAPSAFQRLFGMSP